MNRGRDGSDFAENYSLRHLWKQTIFLANYAPHSWNGSQKVNVCDANRGVENVAVTMAGSNVVDISDEDLRVRTDGSE